jgi:hypothetical protein
MTWLHLPLLPLLLLLLHCLLLLLLRCLQVPGHTAAVLTFRGHVRGRDLVEKKKQELVALLAVRYMLYCHMS